MGSITVRNLDDALKQRLRERAAAHGVSMEQEARSILRAAVASGAVAAGDTEAEPTENLYASAREPVGEHGGVDVEPPQRNRPATAGRFRVTLPGKRILLIVGGGIAAYKSLDLVRRLRERGASVRVVMTAAAQHFVTPLSIGALTADHVFTELFDRQAEHDVGHIRLSREADLIVVAPATADLMAKLATGLANDLASTVLLATDKPVLMAPAMNPKMWAHAATRRNRAVLAKEGIKFVGPGRGEMAESGEAGEGRMAEPLEIVAAVEALLDTARNRWRERRSSSRPGRRTSRSTRSATSPTAPPASRDMRSPQPLPGSAPMSGLYPGLWLFPIPPASRRRM